ncbi:ABC-2 transporter permease [Lachnospiraceae bacterium]|nr:ABC-2 transporter permease [Lachnospiraceae bacterium]
MKSLLLKDIYNIRQNMKQMLLILLFISACMFFNSSPSGVMVFVSVLFTMMTVTTFAIDEQSHWEKYALIMPISRKTYVMEKYMICLMFTLAGMVFGFIETFIYQLATHSLDAVFLGSCAFISIMLGFVCGILYIPILFRFGSEQARLIIIGVIAFLGLVGYLIYWFFKALSIPVTRQLLTAAGFLSPILLLLFAAISYLLSVRFFQAKEF